MVLIDEDNLSAKVFKDMISRLGKKLIKGEFHELLRKPAPAYFHSPSTYLLSCANDVSHCQNWFQKGAEAIDPVERLKYICAGYLGTHHITVGKVGCRPPLNPILGETVQLVF
jgi:hypothetical protein